MSRASHATAGSRAPLRRIRRYTLPFTDHSGAAALTVFDCVEGFPLPPLYSFSLYFTDSNVTPENVGAGELFTAILGSTPYEDTRCPVRLDLYFLPGADQKTCVAHYYREKEARGEFTTQIDQLQNTTRRPMEDSSLETILQNPSRMPGFVPSYLQDPYAASYYHYILWVYPSEHWREDRVKKALLQVEFHPMDQEEYLSYKEESEPGELAPVRTSWERITEEIPGDRTIGETMYLMANGREHAGVWQEAVDKGWRSW